jgi:hypothetical protein
VRNAHARMLSELACSHAHAHAQTTTERETHKHGCRSQCGPSTRPAALGRRCPRRRNHRPGIV